MKYSKHERELIEKLYEVLLTQRPKIIGIQGGQGTGKTTFAKYIADYLNVHKFKTLVLSLDDFYTSAKKREKLHNISPYYKIPRGMPGTHKTNLLLKILKKVKKGRKASIPQFDKSLFHGYGDVTGYKKTTQKYDFIILEGWMVGLPIITKEELSKICLKNKIKLPKGIEPVLKHIKSYQKIWKQIDQMVILQADKPSFHTKWRQQQEKQFKQGQTKKQIEKFVEMFLPLTYACYEKGKGFRFFINGKHDFRAVQKQR